MFPEEEVFDEDFDFDDDEQDTDGSRPAAAAAAAARNTSRVVSLGGGIPRETNPNKSLMLLRAVVARSLSAGHIDNNLSNGGHPNTFAWFISS
mmetsp:Transcript_3038/g.5899  ORF Transcript_3038/g.5899 Transcript_3038/m.5899 type:complete len:93 (-) Transcript_3038:12-290(-)